MHTFGEGKYKVWLEQYTIGKDLVFFLGGGEQPHIGGVVICEPGKKPQIMKIREHLDHVVLEPLACHACLKYNTRVVALGGVHIDHATKKEIEKLVENCHHLISKI